MSKRNEKIEIEKIIEKKNSTIKEELEKYDLIEVLIRLYEKEQFELFHSLIIDHKKELKEELIIELISIQKINEKEIKQFFIEIIDSFEIENIIKNIEKGSQKTKNKKETQILFLKLFQSSFYEFEKIKQIFDSHFNEINSMINSPAKNGFIQIQQYPIVKVQGKCLICKNTLFDGQPVTVNPCGHGVHQTCSDYLNDSSIVCRCCVAESSTPLTV